MRPRPTTYSWANDERGWSFHKSTSTKYVLRTTLTRYRFTFHRRACALPRPTPRRTVCPGYVPANADIPLFPFGRHRVTITSLFLSLSISLSARSPPPIKNYPKFSLFILAPASSFYLSIIGTAPRLLHLVSATLFFIINTIYEFTIHRASIFLSFSLSLSRLLPLCLC